MLGVVGNVSLGRFENGIDLFPRNGGKILDELFDGIPSLQEIEERRNRNARAAEAGYTALNLGIDRYDIHLEVF
jgi:hypothetical protein